MTDVPAKPAGAMTVAGIDIGASAIRMAVAQVLGEGRLEVLDRTQKDVHLGQDTFERGQLRLGTINAAISVLSGFRRILDGYQVQQVRAVATSAVREADNADTFLDRVYTACGLDVEVITPSEESRLMVTAVRAALAAEPKIDTRDAIIVEVGGGSSLVTVLREGHIEASESYRLGSIRLTETLSITGEPPRRVADLVRHQIAGTMTAIEASMPLKGGQTFIAVGSEARFAARRAGKASESGTLHVIQRRAFDRLVDQCAKLSPEELSRKHDLSYGEADTLVPALVVYQALLHATAAKEVIVAPTSMRDGLLLDLARVACGREDEELTAGAVRSAAAIAQRYRCDEAHGNGVAETAVRLFDETRREHGLGARERLLLRVAAMLHEVGGFVSTRAHHKHSYYLLANSEVFGLGREEQEVVALAARYHRRNSPRKSHPEYMAMQRDQRVIVSKLAAMLRVADALDHGHAQLVNITSLERRDSELVIHARGGGDMTLERRSLEGKSDLFEEIFGLRVRLEEDGMPGTQVPGLQGTDDGAKR
jgi:exopolyphosphatase/guanosine-5'-triphosphate,3'-diphosphate pyrophosphatase